MELYAFPFDAPSTPGIYDRTLTWSAFSNNGIPHSRTMDYQSVIDVNPLDIDLDGMLNAYEIAHGLDPFVNDADLDADRDGFGNFREAMFGTDPRDAHSLPVMDIEMRPDGKLVIKGPTYPDLTYHFECSPDMVTWVSLHGWRAVCGRSARVKKEKGVRTTFARSGRASWRVARASCTARMFSAGTSVRPVVRLFPGGADQIAASLERFLAANAFDQDAAHRLGSGHKEVATAVSAGFLTIRPEEAEVGLMHERDGLQGMTGPLAGHLAGGDATEFVVGQRQELFGGSGVAGINRLENLGELVQGARRVPKK